MSERANDVNIHIPIIMCYVMRLYINIVILSGSVVSLCGSGSAYVRRIVCECVGVSECV